MPTELFGFHADQGRLTCLVKASMIEKVYCINCILYIFCIIQYFVEADFFFPGNDRLSQETQRKERYSILTGDDAKPYTIEFFEFSLHIKCIILSIQLNILSMILGDNSLHECIEELQF